MQNLKLVIDSNRKCKHYFFNVKNSETDWKAKYEEQLAKATEIEKEYEEFQVI